VIPFEPGGSAGITGRLVSTYISKYIPGNPNAIVEHRPGAAGLVGTKQVYTTDPKDGTVIVMPSGGFVLQQAIGAQGMDIDLAQMNWLGAPTQTTLACVVRTDRNVNSLQDAQSKEVFMATLGNGNSTNDAPAVLNATLGTKFKLIAGYDGASKMQLAAEGGEVDGFCRDFDAIQAGARHLMEGNPPTLKAIVVLGASPTDHPWLKGVPAAEPLAKNQQDRLLLQAVNSPVKIVRPFAAAPGVPPDRAAALRRAIAATFADPQYIADAEKSGLVGATPVRGEDLEKTVKEILGMDPTLAARLREILK
jgi:tripartite-type tricarboxylate transporter receptor subunit TctC